MIIDTLLSPSEQLKLPGRDLSSTACVVLDILRATTTFVTALAQGAKGVLPVHEIPDALAAYQTHPDALLAGEREGVRITAAMTGSREFDLGNSPREFTAARVGQKRIISTTTNGTRALHACKHAAHVLAAGFVNLEATSHALLQISPRKIKIIASGTGSRPALEDVLAAGALIHSLIQRAPQTELSDAAQIALALFQTRQGNILAGLQSSRNGQRLLGIPALADDVAYCAALNSHPVIVRMNAEGWLINAPSH